MVDAELNRALTIAEIESNWKVGVELIPRTIFELKDVPASLKKLKPYAVFWGNSDDSVRERVLEKTPSVLKNNLKSIVSRYEEELDSWLAGPAAMSAGSNDAYIAFSAMRMSADLC